MAQGITFDIKAKVTGYEASLAQLKRDFDSIDPGSAIGKKLARAIKEAESQLSSLGKNLTPKANSETQIDNIVTKANAAGEAIQEVARLMQGLTGSDLKTSALSGEIQGLISQADNLRSSLNQSMDAGIQAAIDKSETLKSTFASLGAEIDKISAKNGMGTLDAGLSKAESGAKRASEALEKINKAIKDQQDAITNKYANNPLAKEGFDEAEFEAQIKAISNPERIIDQNKLQAIKNQMSQGLANIFGKGFKKPYNLLDQMFEDITPENVSQKLDNFLTVLKSEYKGKITNDKIKAQLTGNQSQSGFANTLIESIFGIDSAQLEASKASLEEKFTQIANSLNPKAQVEIPKLIEEGKIEEAKAATLAALRKAYAEIQKDMQENEARLNNLRSQQQAATLDKETADAEVSNIKAARTAYAAEIDKLNAETEAKRKQLDELNTQINNLTEGAASNVRKSSAGAGGKAEDYKFSTAEIQKYTQALDEVHAKEQLVGKIEGVVQRWFSIYAAVRMVGQAINSVISTVQELDKTITEIAIVTDMTQGQLWDQMSNYTTMARQYASSISGVYQVSQLYYQQGMLNI